MRNQLRESLKGLFRALFLNEADYRTKHHYESDLSLLDSPSPSKKTSPSQLTRQNNRHSNRDTNRVVLVPNHQTDHCTPQQQQDQRVLVDLLEELEQDVFGSCYLEFVGTVEGSKVREEGGRESG